MRPPAVPAHRTTARPLAVGIALALPLVVAIADVGPSALRPATATAATLSSGHVDAISARIVRGRLQMFVKDGTRGSARVRRRGLGNVVLRATQRSRVRLPRGLGAVGRAGSTAWILPQTQRAGVLWVGWNTEELRTGDLRGPLRWSLRRASGPGRAVLFQTGSFGGSSVLFSSARRGGQVRTLPVGVHAHGSWAFTRRGTYRLTFALSGTSRSGRALRTSGTLTFRVG